MIRVQAFATRLNGERQVVNLLTSVVIIKFTGDIPAVRIHQAAQAIADSGTTAVTYM